ncbi:MAG: hypothetical protein NFW04_11365 [Candidatus Accumulibacter sp.]|uniref:hypothetical protein n=1 Tax=Accumulibacter sp. TaxID=2053492 RepID=UPI0025DE344C|nr:hypothetical protein [Accumulibacter sp.]MCM8599238.1 hypothetical protein [Accumulibacter sp.]MCM8663143.1 hypothetical protein [Accumulibacter sp.]
MDEIAGDDRVATGSDSSAWIFAISASGEIGVGTTVVLFPQVLGWLIGQPLDPAGLIVARLVGCAALALGLIWWLARDLPANRTRLRPSLLVYDLGAAAVFVFAALLAPNPLLLGLVALLNLGLGVAVAALGPTSST